MVRRSFAFCGAFLGAAVLLGGFAPSVMQAAPSWPARMNYQGQLTDNTGEPVADGTYSVTFRIWDDPNSGTNVWGETQSVDVNKGLFNVVLGLVYGLNNINVNYLQGDLFLGLEVNSNGEMTPRQQLLPSAYAMSAMTVDGNPLGTSPYNVVQLDSSGKIPAGLVNGGSVSLPLNLLGNGGAYNMYVNNTNTLTSSKAVIANIGNGIAVSGTTASASQPAMWAEGAKYGAIVKTNDAVNGIALQAQGPGSAYASLIDRLANAQVYGLANSASTYGTLGANSNGSGTGAGGSGGYIGVSGSGGSYGAFLQGGSYGAYGKGGTFGVYGESPTYGLYGYSNGGNYGVWGDSTYVGVYGNGGSYGIIGSTSGTYGVYGSGGSYGVFATGNTGGLSASTSGTYGVYSSGGTYGVYATGTSYGMRGSTTGAGGYGVWAVSTGTGATRGLYATASSATGMGVEALGNIGVRGANNTGIGAGVWGNSNQLGGVGVWAENSNASAGTVALQASATASASGTGVLAYGNLVGVSAVGGTFGLIAKGTSIGISTTGASTGLLANGGSYGVQAVGGTYSFYAPAGPSTTYGMYIYGAPNPANGFAGMVSEASCANCRAGWFYNLSATASNGSSGQALLVTGRATFPYMTGSFTFPASSLSTVVSNSYLDASDEVLITPRGDTLGIRFYVSSIVDGSFTLSASSAPASAITFSYFIAGDI